VRFLLKPGWLLFIVGVIAFAVSCYTLLAPWQFRRNAEQQALNQAIAASYAHPPQPLNTLVPPGTAASPSVVWRQATVRGHYLPGAEVLVRLRTVAGDPAFEVLTAFRTDDGRTLAIDRGYLRPDSRSQVPPYPAAPDAPGQLTGRIRPNETDDDRRPPVTMDGRTQVYAADAGQLGSVTKLTVDPGYLLLTAGQMGGLGVVPLPSTSDGPFLSYAWQWLTFGAMALFGLGYFVRLELLQRRNPDAGDPWPVPGAREPAAKPEPEVDPLAQRYGKARF
jgi:cytochrome oxidase assembly protein ShyY1